MGPTFFKCFSLLKQRIAMSVCVCLSLCTYISETTCLNFMLPVALAPNLSSGDVVIWYVFPVLRMTHDGPHGGMSLPQQFAAMSCAADEHLCAVLVMFCARRRRAPRLNESFLSRDVGAKYAVHHCLIGPIPWGHSGPLCHALSLSSSSSSSWTSMRSRRATRR